MENLFTVKYMLIQQHKVDVRFPLVDEERFGGSVLCESITAL